ncbi:MULTISPECIES: hypothetical protein [unclassified Paracoccus (in: a-proteobacteria)]|uniref:hypothetical protein n=1 Tax=unclassified Paracoccus (in: a-proteobacteria) TaxID=2688777 RepID=UPI0012B32223|nr:MULTISPECIES: hypothetical protein [unclassified Paracoccus (in: a-proteobacteria)]UXU75887.1 hypothetical protein GB879_005215 [Paracoccus sp. SMMA_5]UXU81797.1 hypothetical protein GB880_005205 [Paracoccus sp. SMMA_5_TC]
MILALVLSSALVADAASPPPSDTGEVLIREATELLLAGGELPRDLDERLLRLEPAERIRVLVFLRRAGLLVGPAWPAERLLAPAKERVVAP